MNRVLPALQDMVSGMICGASLKEPDGSVEFQSRVSPFQSNKDKTKFLALLQADVMTPCKTDSYRSVVAKRLQSKKEASQNLRFWSQNRDKLHEIPQTTAFHRK